MLCKQTLLEVSPKSAERLLFKDSFLGGTWSVIAAMKLVAQWD